MAIIELPSQFEVDTEADDQFVVSGFLRKDTEYVNFPDLFDLTERIREALVSTGVAFEVEFVTARNRLAVVRLFDTSFTGPISNDIQTQIEDGPSRGFRYYLTRSMLAAAASAGVVFPTS